MSWLLDLISCNKGGAKTGQTKADLRKQRNVSEGERYFFLQSLAAQFGAKGMGENEIHAALSAINQERCMPPKQDHVLRELAAWAARLAPGSAQGAPNGPEPINLLAFPLTDSGNAERMVARFGPDVRYCHEMRRFLAWDGCRWNPDNSRQVNYYAKETARLLFAQTGSLPEEQKRQLEYRQAVERHARKSESAKGRRDALECLSAEQNRIPIHEPQLDPDPLLLPSQLTHSPGERIGVRRAPDTFEDSDSPTAFLPRNTENLSPPPTLARQDGGISPLETKSRGSSPPCRRAR